MSHLEIIQAFGFQADEASPPHSIYAYAPVYHLGDERGEWIVKRTAGSPERALAIACWTRSLQDHGIRVVAPAPGFGENPRFFPSCEEAWVVYPFIHGMPYTASRGQIRAAGELLGAIHAAGQENSYGLPEHSTVIEIDPEEAESDAAQVLALVRRYFPAEAEAAEAALAARTRRYFEQALPALLQTTLPLANGPWDYKASNLIYAAEEAPVLIDADNGGRIPRLYDLAIAALLFHNEARAEQVFTPAEWAVFLEGYATRVNLTPGERNAWSDVLLCAWMDEALWLLANDEAGWEEAHQSRLLLSLLLLDPDSLKV